MTDLHRVGLAAHHATLVDREAWALTTEATDALNGLSVPGLVILATCNRVEVYVEGTAHAAAAVRSAWADHIGRDAADLDTISGPEAVRHLARVAAGLESAVLGEAQILGQVRRARASAQAAGRLSPLLAEGFRLAVAAGRRVRAETGLGQGVASTASAAVALASKTVGGLRDASVVVVGGGEIGRLLVKHVSAAAAAVTLVSRSAQIDGVRCARPEALLGLLETADVVLAGTDRVVLRPSDLARRGADRRLAVVDLGVPRNVDPAVADVPGVVLHDVDALAVAVERALERRRQSVPHAEALVEDAVASFARSAPRVRREALIGQVRRRAERARRQAVDAACGACRDRTCQPEDSAAVPGPGPCVAPDRLTRTVTTRVLHDLTRALRTDLDLDEGDLRRLFALPDDA